MYIHRNYTKLATRYLESFPVLCLIGSRQAGKTSFAKNLAPGWRYFDLERPTDYEKMGSVLY
jgi:predicted AAA+ superfamily ATPase